MSRESFSPISVDSTLSTLSASPNSPVAFKASEDIYDKFIEIYFVQDLKVRTILRQKICNFVGHPAYSHLLRTMDENNAKYIMGYLRSQRSVEMYLILDQIINTPLPTKDDFYTAFN